MATITVEVDDEIAEALEPIAGSVVLDTYIARHLLCDRIESLSVDLARVGESPGARHLTWS